MWEALYLPFTVVETEAYRVSEPSPNHRSNNKSPALVPSNLPKRSGERISKWHRHPSMEPRSHALTSWGYGIPLVFPLHLCLFPTALCCCCTFWLMEMALCLIHPSSPLAPTSTQAPSRKHLIFLPTGSVWDRLIKQTPAFSIGALGGWGRWNSKGLA